MRYQWFFNEGVSEKDDVSSYTVCVRGPFVVENMAGLRTSNIFSPATARIVIIEVFNLMFCFKVDCAASCAGVSLPCKYYTSIVCSLYTYTHLTCIYFNICFTFADLM